METLWSHRAMQNMLELKNPEDLAYLEERFAYLIKAERSDLAILRSRPYVQFRNSVITHLQLPGSSTLDPACVIKFRSAGVELRVVSIVDGVTVWTGILDQEIDE